MHETLQLLSAGPRRLRVCFVNVCTPYVCMCEEGGGGGGMQLCLRLSSHILGTVRAAVMLL